MGLGDHVALITGGTGGLGNAVTRAFLEAGATVIVTYTREEALTLLQSSLGTLASNLQVRRADVTDAQALHALASGIQQEYGRRRDEADLRFVLSHVAILSAPSKNPELHLILLNAIVYIVFWGWQSIIFVIQTFRLLFKRITLQEIVLAVPGNPLTNQEA